MDRPVDVALSVYGKPFQTAVALATLNLHSGRHIDRVFIQEELDQPHGTDMREVIAAFPEMRFAHYRPKLYLGWTGHDRRSLVDSSYRRSIRYQLAWEETRNDHLFIAHNDCVFTGDIVGGMLARMDETSATGVGLIGQCWNCPASMAGVCNSDIQGTFAPTYGEVVDLIERFPDMRTKIGMIDPAQPFPLPECRLNEFACLIDLKRCRDLVMPVGGVVPFGFMTLDIGVEWFWALSALGHRFVNWRTDFDHSPFSMHRNGHAADLDTNEYAFAETGAANYLRENFPDKFQRIAPGLAIAAT